MSRTNFSSSTLVRLLAQATGAGVGAPRQDVAERLSQWLNAFDAVALHGIHQSAAAGSGAKFKADRRGVGTEAVAAQVAAGEAFQRTRAALVAAITAHPVGAAHPRTTIGPGARRGADRAGATGSLAADDDATDYSVFFKRHLELQREMALKIGPLRAQARQVLARSAPHLRPLAALDALMEQTLGGREHKLLAQVPAMLEKRFEQLRDAPDSGPVAFAKEWEAIVLAELHLRLQPVVGMMEAWGASPQTTQ